MFVADTNLTLLKNDITIAIIILVRDRSYHFEVTGKWGNRGIGKWGNGGMGTWGNSTKTLKPNTQTPKPKPQQLNPNS
jgi:hypothetical protein